MARETSFRHSNGSCVDLPLLIPSFSSKGFDFYEKDNNRYSEISSALEDFGKYLEESYLVSTFDLHHNHFEYPENNYNNTALIFLDSGGYELNPEFDSTEPKLTPIIKLPFECEDYIATLDELYKNHNDKPFVIANYDWGTKNQPYIEQIESAREIFIKYPEWSSNFILKPEKGKKIVHSKDIVPLVGELRTFDIIGVTEKELGKNLIDRLKRIHKIRKTLDENRINAPIHIWGGLDPIITPMYCFAGADIFDGVSWLRYLYHNGTSVNRDGYAILTGNITASHDHATVLAINSNLMALQGLATSLRAFVNSETPNFDMFDHNGEIFKKAYTSLMAKILDMKR